FDFPVDALGVAGVFSSAHLLRLRIEGDLLRRKDQVPRDDRLAVGPDRRRRAVRVHVLQLHRTASSEFVHAFWCCRIVARSSSGETVATPAFPTSIPAAWFARTAASAALAPAPSAVATTAVTVSPAPETS